MFSEFCSRESRSDLDFSQSPKRYKNYATIDIRKSEESEE